MSEATGVGALVYSESPLGSFEDAGEEKSESNLSSFILVSEDSSVEVPGSNYVMFGVELGKDDARLPWFGKTENEDKFVSSRASACNRENLLAPYSTENNQERILPSQLPSADFKEVIELANSSISHVMPQSTCSGIHAPMFAPDEPTGEEIASMSSSAVFVDKLLIKRETHFMNANRDLRMKVSKLTKILDSKRDEIKNLQLTLAEFLSRSLSMAEQERKFKSEACTKDDVIASLKKKCSEANNKIKHLQEEMKHTQPTLPGNEDNTKKLEAANKKLVVEKCILEASVKRLTLENRTMFERSSELLSQIQDSRTKRAIEACERQVLMGKVDHLSTELNRLKCEASNWGDSNTTAEISPEVKQPNIKPTVDMQEVNETGKPETILSQAMKTRNEGERGGVSRRVVSVGEGATEGQGRRIHGGSRGGRGREGGNGRKEGGGTINGGGGRGDGRKGSSGVRVDQQGLLTGDSGVECPICGKQLHSRESEFSVVMHVEHCILVSEREASTLTATVIS